jgi:hypothetical protein
LVRIQIRIRRPVPQTYGPDPDPDPALFVSDFQDANNNKVSFLAHYF